MVDLRKLPPANDDPLRRVECPRHPAPLSDQGWSRAGSEEMPQNERPDQIRTSHEPSVRTERIAALRSTIAAGRYHVAATDLAQKLIDHMLVNRPAAEQVDLRNSRASQPPKAVSRSPR